MYIILSTFVVITNNITSYLTRINKKINFKKTGTLASWS